MRRQIFSLCLLGAMAPQIAWGDPSVCAGGHLTVNAESPETADTVCSTANALVETLAQCHVTLERPIHIELVTRLDPGCMGMFHCGEDRIEILSPAAMAQMRSFQSALQQLTTEEYFASILAHELAHAAYDTVPCPYRTCRATSEYAAHVMQVMSLPPEARAEFEATLDMTTRVSRDSLNQFLYFLDPNRFLRKSWVHFRQRPESCGYMADIMAGRIFFDRPDL